MTLDKSKKTFCEKKKQLKLITFFDRIILTELIEKRDWKLNKSKNA